MKKTYVMKSAAIVLAGVLCASGLSGCGGKDGNKTAAPTDVIATVNGEELKAGVVAIMTRYQQIQTETIYQMYFGSTAASMWDMVADEETGETYGSQQVESALTDLEYMMLLRAHAEEFGVALTDEQKKTIEDAAAAFAEANGEEVLAALQTDEDCVREYMELDAYYELMHAPLQAETDREVSDEEAQQTTLTYVKLQKPEEAEAAEETEEETEAAEETEEETEAAEETEEETEAAEETEEETEAAEETEEETEAAEEEKALTAEEVKELAQKILDEVKEDPAQDLGSAATEVYAEAETQTLSYTTNDAEDTTVPAEVKDAIAELKDGELAPELVEAEDAWYIVRLDAAFDEEETELKKDSIISDRETEKFLEYTEAWMDEAEVVVKDDVKAGIHVTSTQIFTQKTVEEETAAEDEVMEEMEVEEAEFDDAEIEEIVIEEGEDIDLSEAAAEDAEIEDAETEDTEEEDAKTEK